MDTPRIGDIVRYLPRRDEGTGLGWNGVSGDGTWLPAIVTRVWGEGNCLVNLRAIADGPPEKDAWLTSVPHWYETKGQQSEGFAWMRASEKLD